MKELKVGTLLHFLKQTDDADRVWYAKSYFNERYGKAATEIIKKAMRTQSQDELKELTKSLFGLTPIKTEDFSALLPEIIKARDEQSIPMENVMEMYHSGDEFLVQKSKDCVVEKFGRFVHSIIRKSYNTYVEKHEEELYQCGAIGLINAMVNYDVNKGAFTTFSKHFVQHEITEQLNFLNNDTTVHYNNMRKKITNAINKLKGEGIEPTVDRICILTELKADMVERELACIERSKLYYLDADNDDGDNHDKVCEYEDTPEAIYAKKERSECLLGAIKRLPPEVRDVLLLRREDCFTNDQIAKQLHITVGQVKSYFQKGIRLLRMDPLLQGLFPEYISSAEREMLKYAIPVAVPRTEVSDQIDSLMEVMGTLPQMGNSETDDALDFLIQSISA